MTTASLYPAIRPTLDLNFAAAETLDPRITFSRASTGTYYDGKTVAKAEENLLLQSQAFDDAYWNKTNSTVTANSIAAPDGTTTADTITDNSTNGSHRVARQETLSVNTPYAISVYFKKGTLNYAFLALTDFGTSERYFSAEFNLDTGVVSRTANGTSGTLTSSSIVSQGNGWYRCQIVGQVSAGTTLSVVIATSDGATAFGNFGTIAYAGTGSTIYAWGAQLEQRSTVTAYTPTTTQPITNYIPVLLTALSGVARLDHNPTTGESLGLLIEEQRTNLLTYSDDFSNTAWTTNAVNVTVVSNTMIAPDGTLTGDKVVSTATNAAHIIRQYSSITSGTTYAQSVYAKAGEYPFLQLVLSTGFDGVLGQLYRNINLATGALGNGNLSGVTVTPVGNSWYRISVSVTAASTTSGGRLNFIPLPSDIASSIPTYSGDGYSGIYIWGAQLEAGSFPTSYIPTVASQVTRSADSASMTGSNFSSWYRQDEMTFYAEFAPIYTASATVPPTTLHLLQAYNTASSYNNYAIRGALANTSQEFVARSVSAGVQFPLVANVGYGQAGVFRKVAYGINPTQLAPAVNGVAGSVATNNVASTMSPHDRLDIGSGTGGSPPYSLNGTIKRIAYYPARLTNTQLQAITS